MAGRYSEIQSSLPLKGNVPASYSVRSITLENIRGFSSAVFDFSDRNVVLIGENNAGKTSLLRVFDWLMNRLDGDLLNGHRSLTPDECDLLLPARPTANKARRVTLTVHVSDGRSGIRFGAAPNGLVTLRIQLKGMGAIALLGQPSRNEQTTDPNALLLLDRIREQHAVIYVPPVREASSDLFIQQLKAKVRPLLEDAFIHNTAGGAPKNYREAKAALSKITSIATQKADAVWATLPQLISGGMFPSASFESTMSSDELVTWALESLLARFVTGPHDAMAVGPEQLGAGLQSALWLALVRLTVPTDKHSVLLLEEPEAFLHPSAQRILARELLSNGTTQVIASTHSPLIVEESDARDIVLVKNHDIFPLRVPDDLQNAKDGALLTGYGAEAIFYQSLLLVEGDGDRLYLERLRQRLYGVLPATIVSKLGVVASGSNTAFGQWVSMLERFSDRSSGIPINYIVVGDSIDAVAPCMRGLRDGGLSIRKDVEAALRAIEQFGATFDPGLAARVHAQTTFANERAADAKLPLHLMPVDLEYAMLAAASQPLLHKTNAILGTSFTTKMDMLARLGSKAAPKSSTSTKAPWIRGSIATESPWADIAPDVRELLWRWVQPVAATQSPALVRPPELR
jgi:ABC-type transport system involved in cytochrome c biogenesis ATPase subunit